MKVLHISTGLNVGGAEMMMQKVIAYSGEDFQHEVIAIASPPPGDPVGQKLRDLGISVTSLEMPRGKLDPQKVYQLLQLVRAKSPDLVQTWMYHADAIGGSIARLAGVEHVAWSLHNTNFEPDILGKSTIAVIKLCAKLSGLVPQAIHCCAHSTKAVHIANGYPAERMVVIPNGFEMDRLKIDRHARTEIDRELQLPPDTILIGYVARVDPQKDHDNFIKAAGILAANNPQVRFLLCGTGANWENSKLVEWIDATGYRDRFYLLGVRTDIPKISAALDIAASAAAGDAFPNIIGEAMCCGTPCVVTDVGDNRWIIGDTGIAVPPKDPQAFAAGCQQLIDLGASERDRLGIAAREWIGNNFEITSVVRGYENLWTAMLNKIDLPPDRQ
jgi:glycosyltransferase involved in cell wall biosynthesis